MRYRRLHLLVGVLCALTTIVLGLGCQGTPSAEPPIHLVPDMDQQPRYEPQAAGLLFADGAVMRQPVPGTVARGELFANDSVYRGYLGELVDSNWVATNPLDVNLMLLRRGQERYNIYCSPCHSQVGDGRGIMVERKYVPPPSFHQKRVREFTDGYIFHVITNGVRNMPAHAHLIPPDDRWAIVSYVRALQRSQNADIADVPVELLNKLK